MSTMAAPWGIPAEVQKAIGGCPSCEPERRPRMFICDYHEGWWDGWDAHEQRQSGGSLDNTEHA